MTYKKVAILISGSGSNMQVLIDHMVGDFPARPCAVISNVPDAQGLEKARRRDVPTDVVDHRDFPKNRAGFEHALIAKLNHYQPDILCLAGFMRVLSPSFVDYYAGKILNIHPSLLPKYRGLNTHRRALEAGDTDGGCTVHKVTKHLDDGEIIDQVSVPILPGDTAEVLAQRVLQCEHQLYPKALRTFIEKHMS